MAARHYADADARIGLAIGAYVHGVLTAYTVAVENLLFDDAVTEAIGQAAADAGTQGVLPLRPVPCGFTTSTAPWARPGTPQPGSVPDDARYPSR
ncbi:hypothetical protein [Streptomyces sp. NPDC048272]|uniref:hypothetical protein n=1 Tax=Streptomyces sp. NPDC048272 TaxID=3154616 RepID=UPI00341ECF09